MDIGQFAIESVVVPGKLVEIEAQQVQHGGVELPDIGDALDTPPTEFISRPETRPPLHSSPHQPHSEGIGIVIPSGGIGLMRGHATKLCGPEDQSVFQETSLLEISQEGRRRLIENDGMSIIIGFESPMGVPVQQAIDSAGP